MIPNPILKVLFTIRRHHVRALLMGGQACVFYGAAEFSRDTDFVVLAEPENLGRLAAALHELDAENIAVPPFEIAWLQRGHAVHFRCRHPEAAGLRVDVMSVLRGTDSFEKLWDRRTTLGDDAGNEYELLSLPDLVCAKKTQRDKDWPMIRRLLEADYVRHRASPTGEQLRFWLMELRTPDFLIAVAARAPEVCLALRGGRPLLAWAQPGGEEALHARLSEEEAAERECDRAYWQPLKREMEELRRQRVRGAGGN